MYDVHQVWKINNNKTIRQTSDLADAQDAATKIYQVLARQ